MVAKRVSEALSTGSRDALVVLMGNLSKEIDESTSARDRLPLVRAFLATVSAIEAMDIARQREARANARNSLHGDSGAPNPIDELLDRRRKRGRAT